MCGRSCSDIRHTKTLIVIGLLYHNSVAVKDCFLIIISQKQMCKKDVKKDVKLQILTQKLSIGLKVCKDNMACFAESNQSQNDYLTVH